jgi:hypothetical protein
MNYSKILVRKKYHESQYSQASPVKYFAFLITRYSAAFFFLKLQLN